MKFLADLLAPIGALMGGEVGEFWRNYMKQSGTQEQQKRWADNSSKYYGKEGETVIPKNRESQMENLKNYNGTDNKELGSATGKMKSNQSRYEAVSKKLFETNGKKIPWQAVAAIHYREGDMNFNTYLHQGDPL